MPEGAGSPTGTPLSDPALIEMISEDPVLRNTKLISEAWDCDGLYQARGFSIICSEQFQAGGGGSPPGRPLQVGAFPHYEGRWAEWNGSFRDTVRQFIKAGWLHQCCCALARHVFY